MVRLLPILLALQVAATAQLGQLRHATRAAVPNTAGLAVVTDTDTGNVSEYTAASWTMEPGILYLVGIVTSDAATITHTHTLTSGHSGVSWTQISTTTFNTPGAATERLSVWRGSSATRVSGTMTNTTSDAATGCAMAIVGLNAADLTSPIVQSKFATNNTANPTVTMDAGVSSTRNCVVAFVGNVAGNGGAALTPHATWPAEEWADVGYNTPASGIGVYTQQVAKDTAATVTQTAVHHAIMAIEVRRIP